MVPIFSNSGDIEYLSSLRAVRERCFKVQEAAVKNKLQHFDIDQTKLQDMAQFVISFIKRDYDDPSKIPRHGRWRHFDVGDRPRIQNMIQSWPNIDSTEKTRRVLDLMVVAVLLDLDPGQQSKWSYRETISDRVYKRREGVAIAVLEMFQSGLFSSNSTQPHRVDGKKKITC